MALPVFISYIVDKHPNIYLQTIIAFLGIMLGLFSVTVLWKSYTQNLASNNPHHFQTKISINRNNILTWCIIILITVLAVGCKAIYDSNFSMTNTNTQMTYTIFNSYPVAFLLLLTIFGPICEEITIRGLFFAYFLRSNNHLNQGIIWLLSSILFMLLHGAPTNINALFYLVSGLLFGGVFLTTRNLQYSLFLHTVTNFITAIWGI